MPTTGQTRINKKCVKACKQCRSMKVRCSGSHPCSRCVRKNKDCEFAADDTRVSISERYLRQLETELARTRTSNARSESVEEPTIHDDNVGIPSRGPGSPFPPSPLEQSSARRQAQVERKCLPLHPQERPMSDFLGGPGSGLYLQASPLQHRVDNGHGSEQDDQHPEFSRNPLVDKNSSFAQSPDGRFWYMGPTSSWSFCRRVLALIGRQVPSFNSPPDPLNLDGMAFKLHWTPLPTDKVPDVSDIPPLDYSLFLYNAVKFYFGTLSCIINEPSYLRELHEFYKDPASKAASSRAWYSQYLLIIAFGKAFLMLKSATDSPPGHEYASRAMSVLPGLSGLDPNPVAGIEAFILAAIYFQSIDMRMAAYNHIGQALRTCVIEGMHRHVPDDLAGPEFARRCRNIFWVVYMLDREFSSLIGAPNSIRDEDITVNLPAGVGASTEDLYLSLHVRLAQLMAQILATVYAVDKEYKGTLISNTQSILHSLAELSQDLNSLAARHDGPINRSSRTAVRLMLSYHHCVVLTTRPLVMCALHMHLAGAETRTQHTITLSTPVSSLLQCCANSAQTILQSLRNLADDDLIETFLPFQVEDASSSAFVLYLIRFIAPSLIPNDLWHGNLNFVLENYIFRGNLSAPLRKRELHQLEQLLTPLTPTPGFHPSPEVPTRQEPEPEPEPEPGNGDGAYMLDNSRLEEDLEWPDLTLHSCLTIPPNELLYLADQLDVDNLLHASGS